MFATSWAFAQVWSKADHLGGDLGDLQLQGGSCNGLQECSAGRFDAFPLFTRLSESVGFGRGRGQGFQDHSGTTQRLQICMLIQQYVLQQSK